MTIVELALVGTLEKRAYKRVNQNPENFEPGTTTTAAGLARRAFQKTFADRSAVIVFTNFKCLPFYFSVTVFSESNPLLTIRVQMAETTVLVEPAVQSGAKGRQLKDLNIKITVYSTWAKLEDDAAFVECPSYTQPDPPSIASTSKSETEHTDIKLAGPPDSPTLAARHFWRQTSIKRRGMVKVITPKLFSKWTGDDLDR